MIVANGVPQSGTHALMASLAAEGRKRLPGLFEGRPGRPFYIKPTAADPEPASLNDALKASDDYFIHGHVACGRGLEKLPCRVVTIRRDPRNVLISYARKSGRALLEVLRNFYGLPFVRVYRSFLGWPVVVRYEDMGFVEGPNLYEDSPVDASTWTGDPSDWRKEWTTDFEVEWRRAKGPKLVADAGYFEMAYA